MVYTMIYAMAAIKVLVVLIFRESQRMPSKLKFCGFKLQLV